MDYKYGRGSDTPDPVDVHIGKMLRELRGDMPMQILAYKVGVSYQQIQKYETAVDRISASRLFHISVVLDVEVSDFFMDINQSAKSIVDRATN